MTTWIENPNGNGNGGRQRGLMGVVRAWIEVIVHPRRFFRHGIAPSDQAPGLVFAVAVTLIHVVPRFVFGSSFEVPVLIFALLAVGVFIAPVVLHLVAALETTFLIPLVEERAGVSQTVQVIAYAAAPCAVSGLPIHALCGLTIPDLCALSGVLVPMLWLAAAGYATVLLVIGTSIVHNTSVLRAIAVTAVPSYIVFGYGFRGVHALELLSTTAF